MSDHLLLSQILESPLIGPSEDRIGHVADCVVRLADGRRPRLTGIVIRKGRHDSFVGEKDLAAVRAGEIRLAVDDIDSRSFERRPGEVLLKRDVLHRAVVDITSARLVRVEDLILEGSNASWEVSAVIPTLPVTFRALPGRLLRQKQKSTEEIPWSHIEPLVGHVPSAAHHLPLFRLMRLHPADIADIVEQASHEEGEEILNAAHQDQELEADIFEELNTEHQLEFLKERSDSEAAEVLANMEADDAADLLMELDRDRRRPILELLPDRQQRQVRKLLGYHPETAGGLMTPEFIALPESFSVQQTLEHIANIEEPPEILTEIYTLKEGQLSGSVPIARIIRSNPQALLSELVLESPIAVNPNADLPTIAVQMADYNLAGLPVIDEAGQLLGVITYDDVLEALLPPEWRWRGRRHLMENRQLHALEGQHKNGNN